MRLTDLDDAGRARLRAAASEHDMLAAWFTADGDLSYDDALDFFSYRVHCRDMRASATDMDLIKIRRR